MRRKLRNIFHFLLWALQIVRLYRYRNRSTPAIIAYGGVTSSPPGSLARNTGRHVLKKKFRRQLRYLRRHYTLVSLDEIARCLHEKLPLPQKAVAVTFDYGYMNTFTEAFPMLRENSDPFAVSLATSFIDPDKLLWIDRLEYSVTMARAERITIKIGGAFLNEPLDTLRERVRALRKTKDLCAGLDLQKIEMLVSEIEKQTQTALVHEPGLPDDYRSLDMEAISRMAGSDIQFGSHSVNHLNLTRVSIKDLREELLGSKQTVEQLTGKECHFFAYPFGSERSFNDEIIRLIEKCGYKYAVTSVPGFVRPDTPPYNIPRIAITNKDSCFTFAARLAGICLKGKRTFP